ncbi:MAG: VWA domain-containing protein, partial [Lewinella sp.]|nr:VWA domain-containing protein [Lewinella sp.]
MKRNKFILPFLSILLLLLPAWKINAQDRDVILVLDESGSMSGNKWESVKYAIQLAAALLDESDRLFVMRQDQAVLHPISLTAKQPSIDNIKKFGRLTETNHPEVIQRAVAQMKNDPGRKKVILFYGDGDWGYVQAACNQLIGAYSR